MNKRQAILLAIIVLAIAVYLWILFFELPDKTAQGIVASVETIGTQFI